MDIQLLSVACLITINGKLPRFWLLINLISFYINITTDSSKRRIILRMYLISFSVANSLCSKNFLAVASASLPTFMDIEIAVFYLFSELNLWPDFRWPDLCLGIWISDLIGWIYGLICGLTFYCIGNLTNQMKQMIDIF